MGKIDDMRRHREAMFAQRAGAPAPAPAADEAGDAEAPAEAVVEVAAARRTRRLGGGARAAAADQGTCSGCGKQRPMHAGIIAVHQKGLGSVCPGSRKPAA